MISKSYGHALLPALVLVALTGCGDGDASHGRELQTSHLRSLISFYTFAGSQLGHPPRSEKEFKQFIEDQGGPMLQRLQLASAEELFVSERDGQPFVVFYAQRPEGVSPDVVAYEQTGVNGTRQIGYQLGMIQEVDEVQFRQIVPTGVAAQ